MFGTVPSVIVKLSVLPVAEGDMVATGIIFLKPVPGVGVTLPVSGLVIVAVFGVEESQSTFVAFVKDIL